MSDHVHVDPDELFAHAEGLDVVARSMHEGTFPARELSELLASSGAEDLAAVGRQLAEQWGGGFATLAHAVDSVVAVLTRASVAYAALDELLAERFGA